MQVSSVVKAALIVGGTLAVILGTLGIFLPVLPTTPFLLLAAFCYARSSERLHGWLLTNRWFGEYLSNYYEGRGMRRRDKIVALALIWASIGWTITNAVSVWWGKLILLAVALSVTVYLLRLKTMKSEPQEASEQQGARSKAISKAE
jgi:uncharacterized membrane protein YbaN (DUF454 family)